MAKLTTVDVASGYASVTALNNNFALIETALENTLSRDGSSPNQLGADLDFNGYNLLNIGTLDITSLSADSLTINGSIVVPTDLAISALPAQTGNATKFLQTSGVTATWQMPDASEVSFTQTGTSAVASTLQSKAQERVSVFDFMTALEVADVLAGTATLNVSTALQAAINYASATSGTLHFPAGTYLHTATLVFKNNARYLGAGKSKTILKYTGSSDQAQINNPVNGSTAANIDIADIYFYQSSAQVAGKANFADLGSSYLTFSRCKFYGAMIQLILDQTEVSRVRDCEILLGSSANSIGIWLTNGAERTATAAPMWTNQILIEGNQFNGSVGDAVADDGGYDHEYRGNNFNGCTNQLRLSGTANLVIDGGEYELPATACLSFQSTKKSGATPPSPNQTVSINGGFFASAAVVPIVFSSAAGLPYIKLTNNVFHTTGDVYSGLTNLTDVLAFGNNQISSGTGYASINNYYDNYEYTPAWTAAGTNPVVGDGVFTAKYSRKGEQVTVNLYLLMGSTTTFGTGYYFFSLPFLSADSTVFYYGPAICDQATTTLHAARVLPNVSVIDIAGAGGVSNTLPSA